MRNPAINVKKEKKMLQISHHSIDIHFDMVEGPSRYMNDLVRFVGSVLMMRKQMEKTWGSTHANSGINLLAQKKESINNLSLFSVASPRGLSHS